MELRATPWVPACLVAAGMLLLPHPRARADTANLVRELTECAQQSEAEKRLACYDAISTRTRREQEGSRGLASPNPAPPAETVTAETVPTLEPTHNADGRIEERARDGSIIARDADGRLVGRDPSGRLIAYADWIISRTIDSMTDAPRVMIGVRGSMEGGGTGRQQPLLAFRCFQRNLEAFVVMNEYLGNQPIPMRIRFDQGQIISQNWSASDNGLSAFARNSREFSEQALQSGRVIVEATSFRGRSYRAIFDLAGADRVMPEIEACRSQPSRLRPQPQQGRRGN